MIRVFVVNLELIKRKRFVRIIQLRYTFLVWSDAVATLERKLQCVP